MWGVVFIPSNLTGLQWSLLGILMILASLASLVPTDYPPDKTHHTRLGVGQRADFNRRAHV